jgi:hypothetical protein
MKAATPSELGDSRTPLQAAADPAASRRLAALTWPAARLGEALELLARRAGLQPQALQDVQPPATAGISPAQTERWLDWAAARLDIELEAVDCAVPELPGLLAGAGPALLRRTDAAGVTGFVLLLGRRPRRPAATCWRPT